MPPANPPPAQDKSRNEYIPSFISQKPFYVTDDIQGDADYLEHQRLHAAPKDTLDKAKWYDRGKKLGPAATKFRKGACENCGAMTHKTKECLSRPRKTGAKYTGRDIQADEVVDNVKLGWDAKRDRWNGYDPQEYDAVVKEYEDLEALKKVTQGQKSLENGDEDPDADVRYGEETDMGRSQPTSTRQLRLREDTAAYLKNLDLDSARYDPKTRSMDVETKNDTGGDLADQGFMRPSESEAFERAQKYAWESQESNLPNASKLHLQANPTEGALLIKKAEAEAAAKKDAQRKYLLDRYGTADDPSATNGKSTSTLSSTSSALPTTTSAKKPPKAIAATSTYTEYTSTGLPITKPSSAAIARSKYPEDIHPNNHTSIFGSWWANFTWGYACCHSTVRNSYCTGEEGKQAYEEAEGRRRGEDLKLLGNGEEEEEDGNADGGIEQQEQSTAKKHEDDDEPGTAPTENKNKKRTLQELQSGISEEEMEAYKRSKLSAQDPMAAMLGRDELVEG